MRSLALDTNKAFANVIKVFRLSQLETVLESRFFICLSFGRTGSGWRFVIGGENKLIWEVI